MSTTALWIIVIALAVCAGVTIGTYISWQPTVHSAQLSLEQTHTQVQEAISSVEQNIAQATEHLAHLEIVVPEPHVNIYLEWWQVFAMTLAVVLGMVLSKAYDRSAMRKVVSLSFAKIRDLTAQYYNTSRIPAYIRATMKGVSHVKQKRRKRKSRRARADSQHRKQAHWK